MVKKLCDMNKEVRYLADLLLCNRKEISYYIKIDMDAHLATVNQRIEPAKRGLLL